MNKIKIFAFLLSLCMFLTTAVSCREVDNTSSVDSETVSSKEESIYPIDVEMTPEEEAETITNLNTDNKVNGQDPKIPSEFELIQDFDPEWAFCHQAAICVFKDKVFCTWSQGVQDEDAEGQRVMMSYASLSDFHNFSKPVCIAEPSKEYILHERLLMNGELFTDGKKIYCTFAERELDPALYNADGTKNYVVGVDLTYSYSEMFVIESTDGINWSKPYKRNECKAWNSDDSTLYYRFAENGCTSSTIADAKQRGVPMLVENYVYKGANEVWHLMSRTGLDRLWAQASYDGGKTWSKSYPTSFSTAATMATFGNLPDGRPFFIGSVTYDIRYPLSLYISNDGYNFNKGYTLRDEIYKMQKDGWAKGGEYAYADYAFDDTYMYIIYSKQKETVEVTRLKLSDII